MSGIQKPIDPNKIELNRLRANKMQLMDSKRMISSQVNTNPMSRDLKMNSVNKALTSVQLKIGSLKERLGIR